MVTCKDVCEGASDYFDGSLDLEESQLFDRHLERCDPCRNFCHTLRKTIEVTQEVLIQEPPPALIEAMILGICAKLESA